VITETISHYRILSKLGAGGMGEVYLAEDPRLGRRVALKILPARFTRDADRVERFEREARAASALSHPNIVTVYEIGQAGEVHFIATELVEGLTLRQRIARGRVPAPEAIDIARQLAEALSAAHAAGVTHRDIKPENIMIREDGYVKVLDFGLAKLTETGRSGGRDPLATRVETAETVDDLFITLPQAHARETSPGMVLGTVSYMSPEQVRGLRTDSRTDLFSFGVVLYEMLAGRPPFQGPTVSDIMVSLLDREPPSLRRIAPDAPEELEWILGRALMKDRDDRYQSARALLVDLERLRKRMQLEQSRRDAGLEPEPAAVRDTNPLPSNSGASHTSSATRPARPLNPANPDECRLIRWPCCRCIARPAMKMPLICAKGFRKV
jgi:eukaryotic-like serine/threonine-protein kinase